MRHWGRALALTALLGAGAAVACGSFGADNSVPAKSKDAGVREAEPPEQPVTTFDCAGTPCIAGQTACCGLGGQYACYGLDAGGCPSGPVAPGVDAGPPPPPLQCTTYLNCQKDEECCYQKETGASCQSQCQNGSASLCRLGIDNCGENADCAPLPDAPLATIGQCVYSGGSSSSSGTSGWGSSGHPWH